MSLTDESPYLTCSTTPGASPLYITVSLFFILNDPPALFIISTLNNFLLFNKSKLIVVGAPGNTSFVILNLPKKYPFLLTPSELW